MTKNIQCNSLLQTIFNFECEMEWDKPFKLLRNTITLSLSISLVEQIGQCSAIFQSVLHNNPFKYCTITEHKWHGLSIMPSVKYPLQKNTSPLKEIRLFLSAISPHSTSMPLQVFHAQIHLLLFQNVCAIFFITEPEMMRCC